MNIFIHLHNTFAPRRTAFDALLMMSVDAQYFVSRRQTTIMVDTLS